MERFTDAAQGYCEMYCKKYGHCFGDPGDCVFQDEVKIYEALKGYEFTGMSPANIRIMEISALREQGERRWIPATERLPSKEEYAAEAEDGTEYYVRLLIAYKTDIVEYEIGYYDGYKWMTEMPIRLIKDVVAWMPFPNMPLPKPPREETP